MSRKFGMSLIMFLFASITIIGTTIANSGTTIYNPTPDMTATIINEVKAYETEYVYSDIMPSTADPLILVEGVNGLDYTYDGLNYTHFCLEIKT